MLYSVLIIDHDLPHHTSGHQEIKVNGIAAIWIAAATTGELV